MSSAPGLTATDWLAAYPPPRSLTLDQEALRIYERAYYIGLRTEGPGDPPITFTTLAAALLVGEDDTSRWFAATAERIGPKRAAVFAEKQITSEILDAAAAQLGEPQQPRLSSDKQLLTSSSRAVPGWARKVGRFLLHGPAAERRAEDLAQVDALQALNAVTKVIQA